MKPFDKHGAFCPPVTGIQLLAIRGAGITVFSGGLGIGIQMLATMILARLLTPADFGLVTMVTTFSLLLVNFGLNGFTEAVIQREDLDHRLASNLFWISIGTGLVLTIGFAAAGSVLARFYHDPLVAHVAVGISPTILVTSAQVLHLALLKRAMRFSQVSANDLISRTLSVAISIILAWKGFGYWSLVIGTVAQPLTTLVGSWWLCRWIPGLPSQVQGTSAAVRFAMHVYACFGLNYFCRNTDNILVGWRFNAQPLGFYKKAYDLFALPSGLLVSSLTVVAVAGLSRLKVDRVQYQRYLLRALSAVAFVGMGLGGELTLVGKYVIQMLLGSGWEPAGRIFTFFGPGIGVMLLYGTTDWIHLSLGRADRWFRWSLIEYAVTVSLFVLGLHWGPVGVAMAWTASFWLLTIPAFSYAGKPVELEISSVIHAVWKYVLASLLAAVSSAVVISHIPSLASVSTMPAVLLQIALISMVFGSLYITCVVLLHEGLSPLQEHARLLRQMIPWSRISTYSQTVPASAPTQT